MMLVKQLNHVGRKLIGFAAVTVVAAGMFASSAHALTLADLIEGELSITNGDKLFSDFEYSTILVGTEEAAGLNASDVLVTAITDADGNLGLRFQAGWTIFGDADAALETLDIRIAFKVTVLDELQLISDAHLNMVGGVQGLYSVKIEEQVDPIGEGSAKLLQTFVGLGNTPTLQDWVDLDVPVKSVNVQKDILLTANGAGSQVNVTIIDQTFSQIPEPSTALLVGAALFGLCTTIRRRR